MPRSSLSLAFIGLLGLTAPLYSTTLLNEDFEELTASRGATSAGAFSTISGTNVDIVGPAWYSRLCAASESGSCIDLDGTKGNPEGQLQSNTLFAAGSYLLSFDLIGSQRENTASTTVTFGNYDQTFTLASADDTDGIVVDRPVILSSPGYLLFVSDTPGFMGDLLDDVVVSVATSNVPEPSNSLLTGSGLVVLVGIGVTAARRRPCPQG
jgi:hypothetical protein